MELSVKYTVLVLTILFTGLSAGLFYGWEVSVIPGTKKIGLNNYLQTMQTINREIINPAFMLVFMGPLLFQIISTYQFRNSSLFWWCLGAMVIYAIGTFGITALGNVPLNDTLEAIKLDQLTQEDANTIRADYETPWNTLHRWRTLFAILSFTLLLIAGVMVKKV